MELPPIWRVQESEIVYRDTGGQQIFEAIYDETPGYVGCTVRRYGRYWPLDGDFSQRWVKTTADGGWARAA